MSDSTPSSHPSHLDDTQSKPDDRQIKIDKVGVRGLRHPIEIMDKANVRQDTVATLSLSVDLPQHFKGTHMSRFVEVLNSHGDLIHVENIPEILNQLQTRLEAKTAHIELEFPYFLMKKAPVTGAKGLLDYVAKFDASVTDDTNDFILSVNVPVTTLCPCSKSISARGAHNQRGYVNLAIRFNKTVWIEDVVKIVEESASCELYSLLKREDEKHVTEKAFDNPVFVEDLVRNVALRCNKHPDINWYRVEAENVESIHNHSAFAVIENDLR
jgi:GTP cyclohydrolase I